MGDPKNPIVCMGDPPKSDPIKCRRLGSGGTPKSHKSPPINPIDHNGCAALMGWEWGGGELLPHK